MNMLTLLFLCYVLPVLGAHALHEVGQAQARAKAKAR